MRDWTLAQTRRRGWFKWDLSNLCLADDINVRDFVGWGKTIQSCKGATELFVLHTFCADRNIAFLTRQHLVARPTRTPARLYYAIGNVPLRTQPSDQLKAYQLSIIRYQITYHNWKYAFGALYIDGLTSVWGFSTSFTSSSVTTITSSEPSDLSSNVSSK